MKVFLGIAIGVIASNFFVLFTGGNFGAENFYEVVNCSNYCIAVDPKDAEHSLEGIYYEPISGTNVCVCNNGAAIQIVPWILKFPNRIARKNQHIKRVPVRLFLDKDAEKGAKTFVLKVPKGWVKKPNGK